MKGIFNNNFIGSNESRQDSAITLVGCPLDATSSFRGGTKFAPDNIRKASWTLETYSPYLKLDLEDIAFSDAGNLELRPGDLIYSLDIIESAVMDIAGKDRKFLVFGGEHLITYPVMKAVKTHFNDIQVVHFDAHCDLRNEYEGQRLSHATVLKRVKELGVSKIFQIGIRSGTKSEFNELMPVNSPEQLSAVINRNLPVYITFDMDVFDPSLVAGVTTPEPGGLTFNAVMEYFYSLAGANIVGADIVELAPDYDASFVSSVCAAKVAREVIILLSSDNK